MTSRFIFLLCDVGIKVEEIVDAEEVIRIEELEPPSVCVFIHAPPDIPAMRMSYKHAESMFGSVLQDVFAPNAAGTLPGPRGCLSQWLMGEGEKSPVSCLAGDQPEAQLTFQSPLCTGLT